MTKAEAIEAMKQGKKVSYQYFGSKEWMTMQGNMICLEDGVKVWASEFWGVRNHSGWEGGYYLFEGN